MAQYILQVLPDNNTIEIDERVVLKIVSNCTRVEMEYDTKYFNAVMNDNTVSILGLKEGADEIEFIGYTEEGETINTKVFVTVKNIDFYRPTLSYYKTLFPMLDYQNPMIATANDGDVSGLDNLTDDILLEMIKDTTNMVKLSIQESKLLEPTEATSGLVKYYICVLVAKQLIFRYALNNDMIVNLKEEALKVWEEIKISLAPRSNAGYEHGVLKGGIQKP